MDMCRSCVFDGPSYYDEDIVLVPVSSDPDLIQFSS